ncbi:MAG: hypothetical protein ACD_62C00026G0003 [uncultured bacterium]|nr:MAG: hypothetical protein ACD_62C00026G0003 [uncultured bacterium]
MTDDARGLPLALFAQVDADLKPSGIRTRIDVCGQACCQILSFQQGEQRTLSFMPQQGSQKIMGFGIKVFVEGRDLKNQAQALAVGHGFDAQKRGLAEIKNIALKTCSCQIVVWYLSEFFVHPFFHITQTHVRFEHELHEVR